MDLERVDSHVVARGGQLHGTNYYDHDNVDAYNDHNRRSMLLHHDNDHYNHHDASSV